MLLPSIGRVASLVPKPPNEVDKVKLKTKDGKEYEIPILTSNILFISIKHRHNGRKISRY